MRKRSDKWIDDELVKGRKRSGSILSSEKKSRKPGVSFYVTPNFGKFYSVNVFLWKINKYFIYEY